MTTWISKCFQEITRLVVMFTALVLAFAMLVWAIRFAAWVWFRPLV